MLSLFTALIDFKSDINNKYCNEYVLIIQTSILLSTNSLRVLE